MPSDPATGCFLTNFASAAMRPAHLRVSSFPSIDDSEAGGVVASIFKAAQPVE